MPREMANKLKHIGHLLNIIQKAFYDLPQALFAQVHVRAMMNNCENLKHIKHHITLSEKQKSYHIKIESAPLEPQQKQNRNLTLQQSLDT